MSCYCMGIYDQYLADLPQTSSLVIVTGLLLKMSLFAEILNPYPEQNYQACNTDASQRRDLEVRYVGNQLSAREGREES